MKITTQVTMISLLFAGCTFYTTFGMVDSDNSHDLCQGWRYCISAWPQIIEYTKQWACSGGTELHKAVVGENAEIVYSLLKAAGAYRFEYMMQRDSNGCTALHVAAMRRNAKIVNLLLTAAEDRRVEYIMRENSLDCTALHEAAIGGNTEIVCLLLEAAGEQKAEYVMKKDRWGHTALHKAVVYGREAIVPALLRAAGSRVTDLIMMKSNEYNGDGERTAVHEAAIYGHTQILQMLMDAIPTKEGKRSALKAQTEGRDDVLSCVSLLKNKAVEYSEFLSFEDCLCKHRALSEVEAVVKKYLIELGISEQIS